MLPKPECAPLLAPGLIIHTPSELQTIAVDAFPTSQTRAPLWQSLNILISELRAHNLLPAKLWIDGSFLTQKVDPDDIDLCIEIDVERMNLAPPPSALFLNQLANHELHAEPRKLHTFLIPSAQTGHPDRINYLALARRWEYDFGTALVSRTKKGIALLEVL